MTGYATIQRIASVEKRLTQLGMRWGYPKSGSFTHAFDNDNISIFPSEENLPVFSRDAELFSGSLEDLVTWLHGVEWARRYDHMLGLTTDKKRFVKEQRTIQDIKNKQLMKILKEKENEPVSC